MNYVKFFKELSIKDVDEVGGKNASLGEMYNKLTPLGINVPNGFGITASAYRYFLKYNNLDQKFQEIFSNFDPQDIDQLKEVGKTCRELIINAQKIICR